MAADRLKVAIISPEKTVYEGEADMVIAPAWDGLDDEDLIERAAAETLRHRGEVYASGAGGQAAAALLRW